MRDKEANQSAIEIEPERFRLQYKVHKIFMVGGGGETRVGRISANNSFFRPKRCVAVNVGLPVVAELWWLPSDKTEATDAAAAAADDDDDAGTERRVGRAVESPGRRSRRLWPLGDL